MQRFDEKEFKSFKTLAKLSQLNLQKALYKMLLHLYPKGQVAITKEYVYAIGEIPVCLVAHLDTVFPTSPVEIFYDRQANVIWSPQGLGADDRAGVFAIVKILSLGLRPHIIFTTDEEIGAIGAEELSVLPCPFKNCKFIIELDRANKNDCVFYSCCNDEFEEFIENYGFKTAIGTFSDISLICPRWGIAGVNLSVGYREEHTYSEVLFVDYLLKTIEKVKRILEDANKDVPFFEYKNEWTQNNSICYECKTIMPNYMLIPTVLESGEIVSLCGDCATRLDVGWCIKCGSAVYSKSLLNKKRICPKCRKER